MLLVIGMYIQCDMNRKRQLILTTVILGDISVCDNMLSLSASTIIWTCAVAAFTYLFFILLKSGIRELNRRKALFKFPGIRPRFWLTGHITEVM